MAARPITIKVINNTGKNLAFTNAQAKHGTVPVISVGSTSGKLKSESNCSVYAENTGMVGPEGSFSFAFEDKKSVAFNFSYSHPYGRAETYMHVTSPDGYMPEITGNLQKHAASCVIDLQVASSEA